MTNVEVEFQFKRARLVIEKGKYDPEAARTALKAAGFDLDTTPR